MVLALRIPCTIDRLLYILRTRVLGYSLNSCKKAHCFTHSMHSHKRQRPASALASPSLYTVPLAGITAFCGSTPAILVYRRVLMLPSCSRWAVKEAFCRKRSTDNAARRPSATC